MKKLFALLMILCMLFTAAALAEAPTFASMPSIVTFDSFFEGTWVAGTVFAGETYVDQETLASAYNISVPAVTIADGMVSFTGTNEKGEPVTEEYPYTIENSQLEIQDDEGHIFVFELLSDNNISMSTFIPGESEETLCITMFMVHPEA